MINVQDVLRDVPHFETFCSVEKLHGLVEQLRGDPRFAIESAGTSTNGAPVHHIRFGSGSVKALLVAFPHCMEPIGGLTVFSVMTLLQQGNRALMDADVEWHIVPCIDPDGAILNEEWTQKPFRLENFMRHFYQQAPGDQVDLSFPITYKNLIVKNPPSKEAEILRGLLDQIRPDFFFSLHNAWMGGAFHCISRDIDHKYYREIHKLLEQHGLPIQKRPIWSGVCAQFGEGIVEMFSLKKHYDYLEQTTPSPEEFLPYGASSMDYLAEIKPSALTFIAEMGYVRHPSDESEKQIGQNLRQLKLRLDADSKFLATVLLKEWEKVKGDLDPTSPFYRAILGGVVFPLEREKLCEGAFPLSRYPMRDVLFNPQYERTMTEGDRFNACMVDGGFLFLLCSHQLVRLLKASPQTAAILQATERLERAFDKALTDIAQHIDFDAFDVIDCDTLARAQLGSGLIVLNSILETQSSNNVHVPHSV